MTIRSAAAGVIAEPHPAPITEETAEIGRDLPAAPETMLPPAVERGFTFALLLSALRCTVQYVIFPFVLPWVGVAASVPPWLTLALSALALFSLVRNIRYLWRSRFARRWSYLALSVVIIGALLLFVVLDLRALLG